MRQVDYPAYYVGSEKRYKYLMLTIDDVFRHLAVIITGILTILSIVVFFTNIFGTKLDEINIEDIPKEYKILNDNDNYFEIQNKDKSAAYSIAFFLRQLDKDNNGEDVEGNDVKIEKTLGFISPKGVSNVLRKYGLKTVAFHGSYNTLRKRLTLGIPIIVFLQNGNDTQFAVLKGYDEDCFYLYDPIEANVNEKNSDWYNRKLYFYEFFELWRTNTALPNNCYVALERNN